jgi:GNAT superfamily N-acetyltransferase
MRPEFEVTSRAFDNEKKAILDPLLSFNKNLAGDSNHTPLNVLLRIEDSVVGGLWGSTAYGWLHIEILFLPDFLRGKGFGRSTVYQAESEAITRGCINSWVDTHQFQAKDFYKSLGYNCFGELPDYPLGFARYFMRKNLYQE